MISYILRRFVNYAILAALATVFAYMAASSFFYPRRTFLGKNPPVPEETIDQILDERNMNDKTPVIERTLRWISEIVTKPFHEKLGMGFPARHWVVDEMAVRAGMSLRLLIIGTLLAAILGVALGVWGAVRQYKASDTVVTYLSFILISTPTFVGGILLMTLTRALGDALGFHLSFTGPYSNGIGGPQDPWSVAKVLDLAEHMVLPTIALMLFSAAVYSRYQRSVMLDVLGSDFIRTARAKGATRGHALIKHGVRVALIPMSTYFAYSFGTILAGAAFTEIVFSWNGMGKFGIEAVQNSDANSLAGNVLFTAALVLFSSTLSEVLYAALDPRVRV